MAKRLIQRRDGRIQRYNIKYISRYQKTGIKINGANVWTSKRTRQQVTYNADYGNSIRAFSFNHNFTEDELENAIVEFLDSNEQLWNFGFEVAGYEDEEISNDEDKNLNPQKIHLQLNDSDVADFKIYRK